jgi:hypothetical protein
MRSRAPAIGVAGAPVVAAGMAIAGNGHDLSAVIVGQIWGTHYFCEMPCKSQRSS